MTHKAKVNKKDETLDIERLGSLYLGGGVRRENLAEECLTALYDHHQCSDDFKEGDEIDVAGVGVFRAVSFHIIPTNEEMMKKNTARYSVRYDGIDGVSYENFEDLASAAAYVKGRWSGVDYCSSPTNFHNDYGQFYLTGFTLEDIGKFTGSGYDRWYEFNS